MDTFPTADFAFLIIVFLGAWEFWSPKEEKNSHINNYLLTSGYFLFFAFILALLFKDRLVTVITNFTLAPFIYLALFFLLIISIYKLFNSKLEKPKEVISRYPEESFLYMDYRFILSKSSDILFQQTAIITMVIMFREAGMDLSSIILSFGLVFGLMHIPLVRTKGREFGIYFVIAAAFSAIFFPYLIINFNYGFVYSYMVHWSFYILTASFLWLRYNLIRSHK